jgi:hypothetical protein
MTKPMGEKKRAFTVVSASIPGSKAGGRYISVTPLDAGRKAGKRLLDDSGKVNTVEFEMEEITRDKRVSRSKARYFYRVDRVKIPEKDRVVKVFRSKKDGKKTEFVAKYEYTTQAIGVIG